jgi:hypothetical protein
MGSRSVARRRDHFRDEDDKVIEHDLEHAQPPRNRAERADRAAAMARAMEDLRQWTADVRADVAAEGRRLAEVAYRDRHGHPRMLWAAAQAASGDLQMRRAFVERLVELMEPA